MATKKPANENSPFAAAIAAALESLNKVFHRQLGEVRGEMDRRFAELSDPTPLGQLTEQHLAEEGKKAFDEAYNAARNK